MAARLGDASHAGDAGDRAQARCLQEAIRALLGRVAATERQDVAACCGITPAQAATLDALRRAGPLRLSALARRLRIRPSTLTRNLRRLGEHGLVGRLRDAHDARAERVSLTAAGRATARSFETLEEDLALDVLRRVPPDRRASVVAALMELGRAFSEATEGCCGPAEAGAQCAPWGHPRTSSASRDKKTRPRREG